LKEFGVNALFLSFLENPVMSSVIFLCLCWNGAFSDQQQTSEPVKCEHNWCHLVFHFKSL
jgi:hypothetical protein